MQNCFREGGAGVSCLGTGVGPWSLMMSCKKGSKIPGEELQFWVYGRGHSSVSEAVGRAILAHSYMNCEFCVC